MGVGPSIKMTTKHHFFCPIIERLYHDDEIDFAGIIVNGVTENYSIKVSNAEKVGEIGSSLKLDGAIVAIDGWGNHHVDFVNCIGELGERGIPSVGLSYIGLQAEMVSTNRHVEAVIDFNKSLSGFESCIVGGNNLNSYDAMKAAAIIKSRIKRKKKKQISKGKDEVKDSLIQKIHSIKKVEFADEISIENDSLYIEKDIEKKYLKDYDKIKDCTINIIKPGDHDIEVNSNLDFSPIACKEDGELGKGTTRLLKGVTVMLTGVEDESGFQPSNIGSSEGKLSEMVKFDEAGTPAKEDYILHFDFLFEEGEGRTAIGIYEAHKLADDIVDIIRKDLKSRDNLKFEKKEYIDVEKQGRYRVGLVKLVSAIGNMYDTLLLPEEPGGVRSAKFIRKSEDIPYVLTPNQCRDGAIHSML